MFDEWSDLYLEMVNLQSKVGDVLELPSPISGPCNDRLHAGGDRRGTREGRCMVTFRLAMRSRGKWPLGGAYHGRS